MIIPTPDITEQRLIAGCLSAYDHLVSAAEKELEGYRRLKKAMLQKMFV